MKLSLSTLINASLLAASVAVFAVSSSTRELTLNNDIGEFGVRLQGTSGNQGSSQLEVSKRRSR